MACQSAEHATDSSVSFYPYGHSLATEDWQGSSSSAAVMATAMDLGTGAHEASLTSGAGSSKLPVSYADHCQDMQQVPGSALAPVLSQHAQEQHAQRAQHAQHEQQAEQEEVSSPRAILRMLGWVLEYVKSWFAMTCELLCLQFALAHLQCVLLASGAPT
eukprot:1161471-Pelagomonas_calceolata.AAC.4